MLRSQHHSAEPHHNIYSRYFHNNEQNQNEPIVVTAYLPETTPSTIANNTIPIANEVGLTFAPAQFYLSFIRNLPSQQSATTIVSLSSENRSYIIEHALSNIFYFSENQLLIQRSSEFEAESERIYSNIINIRPIIGSILYEVRLYREDQNNSHIQAAFRSANEFYNNIIGIVNSEIPMVNFYFNAINSGICVGRAIKLLASSSLVIVESSMIMELLIEEIHTITNDTDAEVIDSSRHLDALAKAALSKATMLGIDIYSTIQEDSLL